MHEVWTHGEIPYRGQSNAAVYMAVQAGHRMPCPDKMPQSLFALMRKCWKTQPENRISFARLEEIFRKLCHVDEDQAAAAVLNAHAGSKLLSNLPNDRDWYTSATGSPETSLLKDSIPEVEHAASEVKHSNNTKSMLSIQEQPSHEPPLVRPRPGRCLEDVAGDVFTIFDDAPSMLKPTSMVDRDDFDYYVEMIPNSPKGTVDLEKPEMIQFAAAMKEPMTVVHSSLLHGTVQGPSSDSAEAVEPNISSLNHHHPSLIAQVKQATHSHDKEVKNESTPGPSSRTAYRPTHAGPGISKTDDCKEKQHHWDNEGLVGKDETRDEPRGTLDHGGNGQQPRPPPLLQQTGRERTSGKIFGLLMDERLTSEV